MATTDIALARRGLFLMLATVMIVIPGLISAPALQPVVPLFAVLLVLQLAPLLGSPTPDLFAPPVLTGILAAIGTAASIAAMVVDGEVTLKWVAFTQSSATTALAEKVLVALILGTASYYVGYYSRLGIGWQRIFPQVRGLVWNRGRLVLVCAPLIGIFVVSYSVFQSRVGVSLVDFTQLGQGKQVWRNDPTISWMTRGIELGFIPVLLFFSWTLSTTRRVRSLIAPGLVVVAVGLLTWRLGQRGTSAAVGVVVLALFHYQRWRVPALLFVTLCFVALTTSNITLAWRTTKAAEQRSFGFIEEASNPTQVLADHEAERNRFSGLALIMSEFPAHYPYLLGKSWTSIVALLVPRWIWPDKVNHFAWQDTRIIKQLGGAPMPAPYVGAFYANFSWPGIVLGMLLFGAFHRGQYEWLLTSPNDQNVILLYVLLLIYFGPSMLNLSTCLQYLIPVWLVVRFVGRRPAPRLTTVMR